MTDTIRTDEEQKLLIKKLMLFFTIIYAIQGLSQSGISGIFYLPMSLMLKEKMSFDQAQLSYFTGLVMIPWAIKPLYGLISDYIPIFGWRRRSWFIIAAGLVITSAIYLANCCNFAYDQLLFFLTATALGIAFCDVLCDAVMVENGKKLDMVDKFQSRQWTAMYAASIASGFLGGLIAKYLTYGQMFWLMAFLPALVFIAAIFFVPEKRYQYKKLKSKSETEAVADGDDFIVVGAVIAGFFVSLYHINLACFQMKTVDLFMLSAPFCILGGLSYIFRKVIGRKVLFCMAFLFWWDFALFLSASPFFYYQRDTLGFSEIFLGTLATFYAIGAVCGSCLFARISNKKIFWNKHLLAKLPLENMLFGSLCIGIVLILTNFLLMGIKSAIALNILTGFVFLLANLTILVIAAKFCPPQIEGTFFALLMAVINLGSSMATRASGFLYYTFSGIAPTAFSQNYWARFLVWLGWPTSHANPKTAFDIFAQYYAIGWLTMISLAAFLLYFIALPKFTKMIKEDKKLKAVDTRETPFWLHERIACMFVLARQIPSVISISFSMGARCVWQTRGLILIKKPSILFSVPWGLCQIAWLLSVRRFKEEQRREKLETKIENLCKIWHEKYWIYALIIGWVMTCWLLAEIFGF